MGGGAGNRNPNDVLIQHQYQVDGAKRHSDKDFLVMPDEEFYGSVLGGHTDLLFSHPVFWLYGRAAGKPLVEENAKYGKLFTICIRSMPHPRTKNNAGYPDGYKDKPFFKDPAFGGVGFRWGMGLDLSERRLCDQRCLNLLDDMSNWIAGETTQLKYLIAITETRYKVPGDEIYASSPVNYVKLDRSPKPGDVSPVIQALKRGDSFVTSGEVLVPSFSVKGTGNERTIMADVEWTFPLEFVEVVWGDGVKKERKIVSATDLPAFGRHRFQIPFNVAGQKWARFAAWDSAGNGAILQPIRLSAEPATSVGR